MKQLVSRKISSHILKSASFYPVITITGPRQSGKTTLTKMLFPQKKYINFENLDLKAMAEQDPRGLLNQFPEGAVLDEVQNVPSLLSYLQAKVDADNKPGEFILTGSNNLLLNEQVSQTLAGRTGIFHLLPFAIDELTPTGLINNTDFDSLCLRGLYPKLWQAEFNPNEYYLNYIKTYLERDLRMLSNVKNLTKFQHFLELCAGRVGSILNKASISSDLGISEPTIEEWISILETGFIVFRLKPYSKDIGKRLIKSPKIYFTDVGIVCALLGIKTESQLKSHPLRGQIYENLVILEIYKNYLNANNNVKFSFYRDQSDKEIDLIIEDGLEHTLIEIKSSQTIIPEFYKNLKAVKAYLQKANVVKQILYYAGENVSISQDGIEIRNIMSP